MIFDSLLFGASAAVGLVVFFLLLGAMLPKKQ